MAIARKHSRTIVVDGVRYRWTLTDRHETRVRIVAELADTPGSRMIADHAPWSVATPAVVRSAIRLSRREGWEPTRRGPDFRLSADLPHLPLKA